jgi:hypothetical protein
MSLINAFITWLNHIPEESTVRLQRDGVYPFLSFADLNQPPAPILTFHTISWLLILAVGVPVVFLV